MDNDQRRALVDWLLLLLSVIMLLCVVCAAWSHFDHLMYSFVCPACGHGFGAGWDDIIDPNITARTPTSAVVEYSVVCPFCAVKSIGWRIVYF